MMPRWLGPYIIHEALDKGCLQDQQPRDRESTKDSSQPVPPEAIFRVFHCMFGVLAERLYTSE